MLAAVWGHCLLHVIAAAVLGLLRSAVQLAQPAGEGCEQLMCLCFNLPLVARSTDRSEVLLCRPCRPCSRMHVLTDVWRCGCCARRHTWSLLPANLCVGWPCTCCEGRLPPHRHALQGCLKRNDSVIIVMGECRRPCKHPGLTYANCPGWLHASPELCGCGSSPYEAVQMAYLRSPSRVDQLAYTDGRCR